MIRSTSDKKKNFLTLIEYQCLKKKTPVLHGFSVVRQVKKAEIAKKRRLG